MQSVNPRGVGGRVEGTASRSRDGRGCYRLNTYNALRTAEFYTGMPPQETVGGGPRKKNDENLRGARQEAGTVGEENQGRGGSGCKVATDG